MQFSRRVLEPHRQHRLHMVKQYIGARWNDEVGVQDEPVNLLAMYVSIVGRSLIAKNPRVMLSTFQKEMKPTVSAMQSWCNKEIERMYLADTLQRVVVDALFSVGICKVALATPADSAATSWYLRAGQPFAELVDLDDFVFDTHARDFSEVAFIGHRYRVPLDVVRDCNLYNKKRREKLTASTDPIYNNQGDQRLSSLGRQAVGETEEFEDLVDLWEVYLPRHRLVITLAAQDVVNIGDESDGEALREQNWIGPECGPYHLLSFGIVPGNAMPKGPIQDLTCLHEATNRTWRKAIRTIDRIKELFLYQGGPESQQRINEASDGDAVPVDNPERIKQLVFSGTALGNLVTMCQALGDRFSKQAGNLDIMGGLAPQSGTATQDKMLDVNSSRSIMDMQDRTVTLTSKVLKSLCYYWKHDPYSTMTSQHSIPGVAEVTREVTPQMRKQFKFEDMDIQVDPYSMQHQTPQSRMEKLNQIVQTIVIPLMGLMQQQGIAFDINAWLVKIGKYMDMPDLADIITIMEPTEVGGSGEPDAPGKPAQTQRTYTRENVPMRTERGDTMNAVNAMRGLNPGGAPQTNGAIR